MFQACSICFLQRSSTFVLERLYFVLIANNVIFKTLSRSIFANNVIFKTLSRSIFFKFYD